MVSEISRNGNTFEVAMFHHYNTCHLREVEELDSGSDFSQVVDGFKTSYNTDPRFIA